MSYDPLNVPKAARMSLTDVLPPKNLDGRRREIWQENTKNRLWRQFRIIEQQKADARARREAEREDRKARSAIEEPAPAPAKPRRNAKPRKKAAVK